MQDEEDLEDKKESVKFLAAMVRDANRLKLVFPEVSELFETHRSVETWIDRANIAIRSRISLTELKALLEAGDEMPVDLSDLMEKLRARVSLADQWVDRFKEYVPCPDPLPTAGSLPADNTMLRWMGQMREALLEGEYTVLHDMASEGSRIPVEVDIVKLLQIELDAKTWTSKAKKWIPSLAKEADVNCKKAKLEDLRDHMDKAAVLREKLDLPVSVREAWALEGEKEICSIVEAADEWFRKVRKLEAWPLCRSQNCRKLLTLLNMYTYIPVQTVLGLGQSSHRRPELSRLGQTSKDCGRGEFHLRQHWEWRRKND